MAVGIEHLKLALIISSKITEMQFFKRKTIYYNYFLQRKKWLPG